MTVVAGTFNMDVSDPDAFIADPQVQTAVTNSIAELNNVPADYVVVTLEKVVRRLRLLDTDSRFLQSSSGSVRVLYDIIFPGEVPASVTDAVVNNMATTQPAALTTLVVNNVAQEKGSASAYTVTVTQVVAPQVQISTMGALGLITSTLPPTTTTTIAPAAPAPPMDDGGMTTATVAGLAFTGAGVVVFLGVVSVFFGKKAMKRGATLEKEIEVKVDKKGGVDEDEPPAAGDAWPMPPGSPQPPPVEAWEADERPGTGGSPSDDERKRPANTGQLRLVAKNPQLPPLPPWALEGEDAPTQGDEHFWRWAREAVVGLRQTAEAGLSPGSPTSSPISRMAETRRALLQRWQAPLVPAPTSGPFYGLPGEMPRPDSPPPAMPRLPPVGDMPTLPPLVLKGALKGKQKPQLQ